MKANKLVNFHGLLLLQQFDLIIINSKCNFFFFSTYYVLGIALILYTC